MKLNLGNHIRQNRRRMNLTQEQLAEKFGVSPQAISRWENGTTYPDLEMLPMIASFFGMSVDAMLGCTDEEKEKFCAELTKELEEAAREKDADKVIELLREIRRNLREYQDYWFWGLYRNLFYAGMYKNEKVLDEIRLLTEEISLSCSRADLEEIIEWMADMEDDEHIDAFLDTNAAREDLSRTELLMNRYKARRETEKYEPVRQFYLWYTLAEIVDKPAFWNAAGWNQDPAHVKWYCETQLHYLNDINCMHPDSAHIVSGSDTVDLWCMERIHLGLSYADALATLGRINEAFAAFEDMIALLERVMALPYEAEEKFDLSCTSPALEGFALKSAFHWMEKDGREYRELEMQNNTWCTWVIPNDYVEAVEHPDWLGYVSMKEDERFAPLYERMKACAVSREKAESAENE